MTRDPESRGGPRVAVVAGAVAQRPGIAGHAWVFLNWLLGLRALGYDVVLVDRLERHMQLDPRLPPEHSQEWRWLRQVTGAFGLDQNVALLVDGGRSALGMDRASLLDRCRSAEVFFNVMGYLDDPEILDAVAGPRVFVDIDPGFPQMWFELGLCDPFEGHDAFVTVGLAVGDPRSEVPTCGIDWITTPPPVDLQAWPEGEVRPPGGRTTASDIATWRGSNGPIDYRGTAYGLRVHELRRYSDLPLRLPELSFRIALDIDPEDTGDSTLLEAGGWQLDDPRVETGALGAYRNYVCGSDLEFSVAKHLYVRSRGGWFSDRSACYLASGRPVVVSETGFSSSLPTGEGLLAFSDPDGAEQALREVAGDLPRHGKAARAIAEEYLDARSVLRRVVARVGA